MCGLTVLPAQYPIPVYLYYANFIYVFNWRQHTKLYDTGIYLKKHDTFT